MSPTCLATESNLQMFHYCIVRLIMWLAWHQLWLIRSFWRWFYYKIPRSHALSVVPPLRDMDIFNSYRHSHWIISFIQLLSSLNYSHAIMLIYLSCSPIYQLKQLDATLKCWFIWSIYASNTDLSLNWWKLLELLPCIKEETSKIHPIIDLLPFCPLLAKLLKSVNVTGWIVFWRK